ncbi:MAG: hypothetical protein J0G94_13390 [Sphingomonadales bacterium]|nr:hypothetical protein [Sphingomonadales bacterium]
MIIKLLSASVLAALSTAAAAQSLADTHQQLSVPGKTVVAYRPIAPSAPGASKCHPDATKAVACEARAQNVRMLALAAARQNTTLSQR